MSQSNGEAIEVRLGEKRGIAGDGTEGMAAGAGEVPASGKITHVITLRTIKGLRFLVPFFGGSDFAALLGSFKNPLLI
ncbi:MAG: hypothetical protein ACSHYB_17795 [Roseibacillus sp.]